MMRRAKEVNMASLNLKMIRFKIDDIKIVAFIFPIIPSTGTKR